MGCKHTVQVRRKKTAEKRHIFVFAEPKKTKMETMEPMRAHKLRPDTSYTLYYRNWVVRRIPS